MSATPHTGEISVVDSSLAARRTLLGLASRVRPHHAVLLAILGLSAVLNTHRLSQNGWANTFYSAGVASMLRSLHNFLFVSFDPGGLVTIDKPPLGVWVQAASAKLFGLTPLSLLLPEAIGATLTVALLYRVVARRLGPGGGLAGAAALAVFPSFVAVSRDNGVDTLLILLMLAACGATLRAIERGGWRWLLGAGVLVGLAFNTKTLAAYLVVPGIAAGYLVCAPGSALRRAGQLATAGVVAGLVSFSWIAIVELTPASSRPFVGSSTDNSEWGLTFEYNGFGRVEGELGGPGRIPVAPGASLTPALLKEARRLEHRHKAVHHGHKPPTAAVLPNGRKRDPIAFGEPPGPLRLFVAGLGPQGAWLLPLALFGLIGLALQCGRRVDRRDRRLALGLVLGGWFLVEATVLSLSKGIVHPYYVSALAPGAAAMVGAGTVAFADFARRRDWRLAVLPLAVAGTVAVQLTLLDEQHYMRWFIPVLVGVGALGVCMTMIRRLVTPAIALTLAALLVAPAAFAATTWLTPVYGTFPAAGPHEATGEGMYGLSARSLREYRSLVAYVSAHRPGNGWALLADASPTAAPFILMGLDAAAVGGYSGSDPAVDGRRLARMVARGQARYVMIGGAYSTRGGNLATKAVLRACSLVSSSAWHGPPPSPHAYTLFDCAGHERGLAAEPPS